MTLIWDLFANAGIVDARADLHLFDANMRLTIVLMMSLKVIKVVFW